VLPFAVSAGSESVQSVAECDASSLLLGEGERERESSRGTLFIEMNAMHCIPLSYRFEVIYRRIV
jgi:hypothetical protein